jgi:hypothetical protein
MFKNDFFYQNEVKRFPIAADICNFTVVAAFLLTVSK